MTEYNDDGTPRRKKTIMRKFRMSEISLVDTPAQAPARITIMKRAVEKNRRALTTMDAGHAHSVILIGHAGDKLMSGSTSYVDDHSHDWIEDDAGNIILADARGHNHGISVLVKNQDGDVTEVQTGPAIYKTTDGDGSASPEDDDDADKTADTIGKGTNTMTTKSEPNADDVKKAEDQSKLDDLQKQNDRLTAVNGLSADQRAHFDSLSGDEADAFLAKSADERGAILKNLADADSVVYTAKDGSEFRKSDDPRLVEMAKRNDAATEQLAKAEELRKADDLRKRGNAEFGNLNGDDVAKGALLGAIEGISDETLRTQVLTMVKANDAGLAKAFERQGTTQAPDTNASADEKLDALAKKYVADNQGTTIEQAHVAVLETPEGAELYAQRFQNR